MGTDVPKVWDLVTVLFQWGPCRSVVTSAFVYRLAWVVVGMSVRGAWPMSAAVDEGAGP